MQNSYGSITSRIRFNQIDGFIEIWVGIRYWLLFDKICDRIKYIISEKSGITDSISHNFGRIRTDSFNYSL